jgi:hypothetical protein
MANTTLQIRHSTVAGNTPSSLANGEIAINSRDGVLYYSTPSGAVTTLTAASGPSGLNKEIQFNDSGALGGNNKLTFDKTTGELVVNGTVRANIFSDDGVDLYDFSNRAFSAANAAFGVANSAFANNNIEVLVFESQSNGSVASYDIGYNPVSKEAVMVTIAGIVQPISSYTVNTSANTITFSENPQNGELVRVASFYSGASPTYLQVVPANVTPSIFETSANGSTSSFALGFNPGDSSSVLVSIAGIVQPSDAYSVDTTSNTITFIGEAPANGEKVRVVSFYSAANVYVVNNNSVTFEKLETTVNTKISLSLNQANAAFSQANAAFISANNIDGVNSTQNTNITYAWNHANAAFDVANTEPLAQEAYYHANSAFDKANTAFINAAGLDGINNTQNNRITYSEAHANAAFLAANNAGAASTDIYARNHANAAFNTANAGGATTDTYSRNTANAAFTKANNALANTGGATFDGILNITGTLRALSQGGDEGGEIFLDKSANNTSLAAGITIDVFQNKLRFFENGGSVRGVFIDIANSAAGGVGTDLLAGGVTTDSYSRNTANAAFIHANAAFATANAGGGGGTTDVYARNHANAAFTQANTGASPSRTTVSATTTSLVSNATANLTVTMAKGYGLYKIAVSTGAWVTVYGNIARRNADFTRSITTDPVPGAGVIAEAITTGTTANVTNFTPSLIGYNDDVSVTTNAYIKVYNNSGVTNTVTVTVTYLPLEV